MPRSLKKGPFVRHSLEKKVSKMNTKIIFDTIRAEYFKKIFKNVEIIRSDTDTVHKSKRIICSQFLS